MQQEQHHSSQVSWSFPEEEASCLLRTAGGFIQEDEGRGCHYACRNGQALALAPAEAPQAQPTWQYATHLHGIEECRQSTWVHVIHDCINMRVLVRTPLQGLPICWGFSKGKPICFQAKRGFRLL